MKTKVIIEEPIIEYRAATYCSGCNLHCEMDIRLYTKDLFTAEVGKSWAMEEVDQCPNATIRWDVSYTVVYKDENGVALLYRNEEPNNEETELLWIELRR